MYIRGDTREGYLVWLWIFISNLLLIPVYRYLWASNKYHSVKGGCCIQSSLWTFNTYIHMTLKSHCNFLEKHFNAWTRWGLIVWKLAMLQGINKLMACQTAQFTFLPNFCIFCCWYLVVFCTIRQDSPQSMSCIMSNCWLYQVTLFSTPTLKILLFKEANLILLNSTMVEWVQATMIH